MIFTVDTDVNMQPGRVTADPIELALLTLKEKLIAYLKKRRLEIGGNTDLESIEFSFLPLQEQRKTFENLVNLRNHLGDVDKRTSEISTIIRDYTFNFRDLDSVYSHLNSLLDFIVYRHGRNPFEGFGDDGMVKFYTSALYISPKDLKNFNNRLKELEKIRDSEMYDTSLAEMIAIISEFPIAPEKRS